MPSPYERALGDRVEALAPSLRAYFSAVPPGGVGIGSGVFDVVGTPRRWLWPALWVLARQGVLFPVWRRSVPFTVRNRAADHDVPTVHGRRTFHFPNGDRTMIDAIGARDGGLTDELGRGRRYVVELDASVVDGALRMASRRMMLRLGSHLLPLPAALSPRVTLLERFDPTDGRQHVGVTVDLGRLGRLYEYSGSFVYRVEREDRA